MSARTLPGRLDPRATAPSQRTLVCLLWVAIVLGCFALAFATRGQIVTWDGLVAVG